MKKITFLLLAALLVPMTINAQVKMSGEAPCKVAKVAKANTSPTTMKATLTPKFRAITPKADVPEGFAQVTLTAGDVWEDGSGYQMLLDADATAYGTIIPETGALTTSGNVPAETYAEFEYKIPENADGALTTANIVINSSVTITIPAGTYDYCITNPTAGDRMWIATNNGTVGGRADNFEFVSGAAYEFVVSLSGQNDQVDLVIDDPTAPAIPTNVYVTPAATTADVAWEAGINNSSWNLRYRPYVDPALLGADWSMTIDNYQDIAGQFTIIDADGDGENWSLWYADEAQTEICFGSESYSSSTYAALTPDNWLVTPEVGMGGTLKFKTWNYSSSYLDQIAVYYAPADWETTDDFIQISDILTPGTTAEEVEIDLSDYEGLGVIAFRHFGTTDMWRIMVSNIQVILPGAPEVQDWIVVEDVTNPYTIEGLTPETEYEVQVQAASEDNRTTDWTESVIFTTLAEGEQPVEEINNLYLTGTFTDWSQNAEGCIAFEEVADGVFEAKADIEAGGEFKIITFAEDGAITWFGGIDETQAGFYLITPELLNVPTALIDGSNFKMQEGAVYIIRVTEAQTAGIKGVAEPLQVEFIYYAPTAIENLNTDNKVDNTYYNLQGVKFNGMPSVPGIYINGGKKVIVK